MVSSKNIPIIFLSARSTDLDKIMGLGMGADDYVTKPFSPLELGARVKSQLRRYHELNPGGKKADKNQYQTGNERNHPFTHRGILSIYSLSISKS